MSKNKPHFQQILQECETSYQYFKENNFTTNEGLNIKISTEYLPMELRNASCHGLKLYLVQQDAQNCLQEIGYLRELAFRRAGGGVQQKVDLDDWDYSGFWQLICLDLEAQEICGAYRLLYGIQLCQPQIQPTRGMGSVHSIFDFSPTMLQEILPNSIELGRTFVNENAKRASLALPLLFEALGQLVCQNVSYILGKITFYPRVLGTSVLWLLYSFFEYYWRQPEESRLAWPRPGLDLRDALPKPSGIEPLITELLNRLPEKFDRNALRQLLEFLEPLYKQQYPQSKSSVLRAMALFLKYLSLLRDNANGMHILGGALNSNFGDVIEFMCLSEVNQFQEHHLQRWKQGCKS